MAATSMEIELTAPDMEESYTYSFECEDEEQFVRQAAQVEERLVQLLKNLRSGGQIQNVSGLAGFAEQVQNGDSE